ncbi:hypothetical protein [Achromobacter sp. MFA1 R4]|uniref:hypothetical protein n=1 Tax=Achromobacter sp. MFA1 R4 TaxID=1881016 RepID=UPI0009537DFC|nr:hypothetical protein [Achromobacter sp. MFA1 R4]SIT30666.1 hypothetical protein SAMN05428937_4693 [Achromobacter sp. MFA1 R4]
MRKLAGFRALGTAVGTDTSIALDEISIIGSADTFRALGNFLLRASREIQLHDIEHMHLQDAIADFSQDNHVDIIVLNERRIKQKG